MIAARATAPQVSAAHRPRPPEALRCRRTLGRGPAGALRRAEVGSVLHRPFLAGGASGLRFSRVRVSCLAGKGLPAPGPTHSPTLSSEHDSHGRLRRFNLRDIVFSMRS
jgi:hypothetical protein